MPTLEEQLEGLPKEYHNAVKVNAEYDKKGFFLEITPDEEKDYRQWAREEYVPEKPIDPLWHPVQVDECIKIIKEFIAD